MVIIHKDRAAVPVTEMKTGTCFFDGFGQLFMTTDDIDSGDHMRMCVQLETGILIPFYDTEVQIPVKIVSMEVE